MSVSSNSRKESTESYAAQQMHSTMGIAPELAQLNDKNLENDLPSRVASSRDTDVPGDIQEAEARASTEGDGPSDADIEESKRASWGQPPLSPDADDASTDENNPMTAYQQPINQAGLSESEKVADADWNRSTLEGQIPVTQKDEPDRTLGNS
ncbi:MULTISPECIES: hypothetical protein [Spirosoma]|uniref:Uncharacterized protein n=1 Tax=Spirosoma liriopis TaxID=2937440 RepID=A0ABT0HGH3_9BACT|nr:MULTISPECIES: hypothetical protein [Spirosoma]MCK8490715.1 hypothetical protein [Spirosoma liriopis]UHG90071.1 hypothetical protein LQ777_17680 [Spirosoma oryzicola]